MPLWLDYCGYIVAGREVVIGRDRASPPGTRLPVTSPRWLETR